MVEIQKRELRRSDIKRELKRIPPEYALSLARASKVVLRRGADLAHDNANQFLQDAQKLIELQSHGHATALAMHAAEECAKMLVLDALSATETRSLPLMSRAKIIDAVMTDHEFKIAVFICEFNTSKLASVPTEKRLGDFSKFFQKIREQGLYVTRLENLGFTPDEREIDKAKRQNGWVTPLDEDAGFPQLLVKNIGGMLRKLENNRNHRRSNFQRLLMGLLEKHQTEEFTKLTIKIFGEDAIRQMKPSPREFVERLPALLIKRMSVNVDY